MASPHTGYSELIYLYTDKIAITLKGQSTHPNFQQAQYTETKSDFKVFCKDEFSLSIAGYQDSISPTLNGSAYTGMYITAPIFYEQQNYEIIIEATDNHSIAFWHDNIHIRNKVSLASRKHPILSGVVNFGNEIGLSELCIQLDGTDYLRLIVEVFPTKIDYVEDYKNIIDDVTREVYNLAFDFLKKTYLNYCQGDSVNNSPVEFFAVIKKIYTEFIRAVDMILTQPHHELEMRRNVLPSHKIKKIDNKTIRWVEQHPKYVSQNKNSFSVSNAFVPQKQVTYDTNENRLTKYILQSTINKLKAFKKSYLHLQRELDSTVVENIDNMIKNLYHRCNNSFLAEVRPEALSPSMSLVFTMAPGYREMYKCYLMLLHGLSIHGDVFHISMKDLPLLYEYWCFIKLNSIMKEKYELISQDIIRIQGNGLFVSLVKGRGSKVKYRNAKTGEIITLSYNPKRIDVPTITQKPDNVLTLEKHGANIQYEYIFDAKYRINPALKGSDYYNTISHYPGPEVDDINTMHRYRDAIVYNNNVSAFERTMFGAYVLFPYNQLEEYQNHRFYQSISTVNIGGLPFLPSATELVENLLDELISDSPESAFERAPLPLGIEEKLKKTDWSVYDVLIGALKNKQQLNICLQYRFYHVPVSQIKESCLPIHYVAIYQSKNLFGKDAGIRYYGEVTKCYTVKRSEIKEIPKQSNVEYYRFEIKKWKELSRPILPKEAGYVTSLTNLFLLQHSYEVPELSIRSEAEYRLFSELKRLANHASINDENNELHFNFNGGTISFDNGYIYIYKNNLIFSKYSIEEFTRKPKMVFHKIRDDINLASNN